MQCTRAEGTSF